MKKLLFDVTLACILFGTAIWFREEIINSLVDCSPVLMWPIVLETAYELPLKLDMWAHPEKYQEQAF